MQKADKMALADDRCDIVECSESITLQTNDAKHSGEHQDQTPQFDEAASACSPTSKAPDGPAPPVIVWRGLMLQQ